ncbi:Replication factor A protein 1 [Entomophthora muscae]|uniref:Replication factor A protein 1 n=1 Tax=Entomophthora muscae TaxID=34485 RepID=A0ACC2S5B4_9FUNG|nr:Replication factor A protein 1 [Entomophthora muscae]
MDAMLSRGAFARLQTPELTEPPGLVLQVVQIKKIDSKNNQPSGPQRYRGFIYDGITTAIAVFQGDLADHITASRIRESSYVKFGTVLTKFAKDKLIFLCCDGMPLDENNIHEAPTSLPDSNAQNQPNSLAFNMQQQQYYNPNPETINPFGQNQGVPSDITSHRAPTENLTKILKLNPFVNKWTVEATVSFKSEIKTYRNAKGDGKLFNVQLLDDSGEIRATGFNEQLDTFYHMLEVGKSYKFSQLRIGNANKRFSTLDHDYELTFTEKTEVEPSTQDKPLPNLHNFVSISQVEDLSKDSTLDIIAVIKDVGDAVTLNSAKTKKELTKRDIVLVDTSMKAIRLTIWDKPAMDFSAQVGTVLACRSLRVAEFQGKTLNSSSSTMFSFNPDLQEAYNLLNWWKSQGSSADFSSFTTASSSQGAIADLPDTPLSKIKDNPSFGMEKPEAFNTTAMFCFIRENPTYPACPQQDCNKKVTDQDGQWYCAKCNRSFDRPEFRYIMSGCISDSVSSIWVQLFNEQASVVMGDNANSYEAVKDSPENVALIHNNAYYKPYKLTVLAKADTYNEITRIRYSVRALKPLVPVERAQELCNAIDQYC